MTEHRLTVGGVRIVVDDVGPADGPVAMVLHGFAGSSRTVTELVAPLVEHHRVLVPDLIGHGRSDAPASLAPYTMDACIEQLEGVCGALGVDRLAVVGYSMGGRVALQWAVRRRQRLSGLVTIGATPGLADPVERAARVDADGELAQRLEVEGITWFAGYWPERPIFATQADRVTAARRAEIDGVRRGQHAIGLANSLRGMGTGAMTHLRGDELAGVRVPALVLAGADDAKFTAIGRQLAVDLPGGRFESVPEAGHAAHLEQPTAVARLVGAELG